MSANSAAGLGRDHDLDSWDLFVLRHQSRGNLVVHFVSWLMFFFGPVLALVTWNPWWLIAFLASGLVGAGGHYAFKDSGVSLKEATSSPAVPLYVTVMFYKLARRRYWDDVAAAQAKFDRFTANTR